MTSDSAARAVRETTLVVEIPVTVIDPDWDDQTLIDNAVDYLNFMIYKAEKSNKERFPEEQAYEMSSDLTVWTLEGYTADLNDLAGANQNARSGRMKGG